MFASQCNDNDVSTILKLFAYLKYIINYMCIYYSVYHNIYK